MGDGDYTKQKDIIVSRIKSASGLLEKESWYVIRGSETVLHRENLPAVTTFDSNEKVIGQEWHSNNALHRKERPAIVEIDPDTRKVVFAAWYQNGKAHRVGAPAIIEFDPYTRIVIHEEWCEDNQMHRLDGPADIWRDGKTGQVTYQAYFRRGVASSEPEPGLS